jgi:glucose/arabinose dehydrogenase
MAWVHVNAAHAARLLAVRTSLPCGFEESSMLRVMLAIAAWIVSTLVSAHADALPLETIALPPGFSIDLLASVDGARGMALGANGTPFVGSNRPGKVYAIRLSPGVARETFTLASGLRLPVGVALRDGALYVSAVSRILRFDDIDNRLANPPAPVVVTDRLPTATRHGRKFIAEHRSWNRSAKIGYRLTLVRLDDGRAVAYEPFATGWLQGQEAWGRQADLPVMPDGSLLVSDDYAGAICRISYRGPR